WHLGKVIPMAMTYSRFAAFIVVCLAWAAADFSAAAAASDAAIAKSLEKIYASVTLDAENNITTVDFSDADYSDKDLAQLRELSKLDSLVIPGSAFTDRSIPHVCGLEKLTQLTLENTSLTSAGLRQLRDLPALKSLNVRRNSALTDGALEGLQDRFPRLERLDLLFNYFTDAALDHVVGLADLKVLDLRGCVKITDAGVRKLAALAKLERLKLSSPEITDAAMETIRRFPRLKGLW